MKLIKLKEEILYRINIAKMDLIAEITRDEINDAVDVNFVHGKLRFYLGIGDPNDYYKAADACNNGTYFSNEQIFVSKGVVIISINNGLGDSMEYEMEAKNCADAFMSAYKALIE